MTTFKLVKYAENFVSVIKLLNDVFVSAIPFDPANTDYQRFKTEIESGEAELQDSEGVTMSPEEAKAYVATLP